MALIGIGIGILVLLVILGLVLFELQYRRRQGNALALTSGDWNIEAYEPDYYRILGDLEFQNLTRKLEIMVPEVHAEATLLSGSSLTQTTHTVRLRPNHPDMSSRPDDYWFAYIVKGAKTTHLEIEIEISGPELRNLKALWVRIEYVTYGPQGRIPKRKHVVVPLKFPTVDPNQAAWRPTADADILPIPTHLLTHLDTPVEIVKRYVAPYAQPGDIVTLGETPVAIMQGRWRHPTDVKPGWLARHICYYFLPTSSLATACGMQTLVDQVGAWRVAFAFIGGSLMRLFFRYRGGFYQLAGEQARLIDDVTGTLPPYDQFIVLGPDNPQQVVDQIRAETGLAAAIVDVNDLKAVKILAATSDVSLPLLERALIDNPAGNADEQTPLVLIRPAVAPTLTK
ncbi:MAG: F420-0:Gamma-glutamyl ligase [Thainema sp.]